MAFTRSKEFYDLIGQSLNLQGFTSFSEFVNTMFAEKYNAEKTFSEMGFPLNPNLPIRPTYEQLEATIRPYTMAGYVDIDSDGPTKSTDGVSLKMGELPTFKHEFTIGRKDLRDQMYLANAIGDLNKDIVDVVMDQLFIATDDLLGGNYNTFMYQRHQIVSNKGKLVINAKNNPLGIPLLIDFGVPTKNISTSVWYKKAGDVVTEEATIDPIKDLKAIKRNARQKDGCPNGHYEMSQNTWDDLMAMPYFRSQYALVQYPTATQDSQTTLGSLADEATIKAWLERVLGSQIVVIDHIGYVEKFDEKQQKMVYDELPSFEDGVIVYVPDGAIGDAQFGRPIYMQTPGARVALYDGGRTLIRQIFNDENMIQTIKSEVQGLCVPNKTRWMYYLTVKG